MEKDVKQANKVLYRVAGAWGVIAVSMVMLALSYASDCPDVLRVIGRPIAYVLIYGGCAYMLTATMSPIRAVNIAAAFIASAIMLFFTVGTMPSTSPQYMLPFGFTTRASIPIILPYAIIMWFVYQRNTNRSEQ
jgi:hypothetical protein